MNNKNKLVSQSKFLSMVLRHKPQSIGLTLDEAGWATTPQLLERVAAAGKRMSLEDLRQIVAADSKQRFAFSEDGLRIRASQGHSIEVDLGLSPEQPPDLLYHGTATRFLDSIRAQGLTKQSRHHVHLSAHLATASAVGQRYGKLAILLVDAKRMHEDGHVFYQSDNGVWLTDAVPVCYLRKQE